MNTTFLRKKEATLVLKHMKDILRIYNCISVADMKELSGLPTTYRDNKVGWISLDKAQIRKVERGYLLDLPQPEPIQ